ncbi:MULE transposase domain [Sesbania bispinosa]|nr:MULE transposase domain [Sesbania bispinosa]
MSITDEEVEESSDEEDNDPCGETDGEYSGDGMERANMEEVINIDSFQDIRNLNMKNISPEDVKRCDFANMGLAYEFYSEYAKGGGRDKKRQSNKPKREAKREIRCGCKARLRVHVDINSGRWKMSLADIMEMKSLRNVGISTPDIYVAFAIIEYLEGLRAHDPYLYYRHTVDEEDRLRHLFWCDGIRQMNYQVFGDVLAFDATYGKNKYRSPLVVFSGVNHHNRTTIFASAVVANETKDTYVWLLQKFNVVMKGKSPKLVITDGDMAMRNAIKRVFPNAHHRLCAWHLLRNSTSNVGIPDFISDLKSNIDVAEFQIRWDQMVSKFGLEDHCWVKELYEKRKMWASSHIRDATEIPKSLILDRWTKIALEIITSEIQILKNKHGAQFAQENTESQILDGNLPNPTNVRSKGCGTRSGSRTTRGRRLNKCSVCEVAGHNKKSCPQQRPVNDVDPSMCGNSMREVGEGSSLNNINLFVDLCCSRLNGNPPLQ